MGVNEGVSCDVTKGFPNTAVAVCEVAVRSGECGPQHKLVLEKLLVARNDSGVAVRMTGWVMIGYYVCTDVRCGTIPSIIVFVVFCRACIDYIFLRCTAAVYVSITFFLDARPPCMHRLHLS